MGKNIFIAMVLILMTAGGWSLVSAAKTGGNVAMNGKAGQKKSEQKTVFACNMLALDATARKRHIEVTKQLRTETKEVREISDGYAFRFTSDQSTILLVSEFIARERLCCPFFQFELVVEPEDGPLWMRLHGSEGVKDFIKAEFGIK